MPFDWPEIRRDAPHPKRRGKLHEPRVVKRFLAQLEGEARDEAELAVLIGLRASELRSAKAGWLERGPAGRVLHVQPDGTKGRRDRWIGLVPQAARILTRLAKGKLPDEPLLSDVDHRRARQYACKRILYPIEITLRDLRHCFMTWGLQGSGDAAATQAAAGHRDLRTTQLYQHTTHERARRVSQAAAKALKGGTRQGAQKRKSRQRVA
jgi:integrase